MKLTSIAQYRLLRFAGYCAIAMVAFGISMEDLRSEGWIILGMSVVMAAIISFASELSDAKGSVLYIYKDTAEQFITDMKLLGFEELSSSGKNIYLRRGMDIVKLAHRPNHYQVELPAIYELVGERYRSI